MSKLVTAYETYGKPNAKILDYNTMFSGIIAKDPPRVITTLLDVKAVYETFERSKARIRNKTKFGGIIARDQPRAVTRLRDAIPRLMQLFGSNTILIGQALNNDPDASGYYA
ncbi:hypothetical protein CEXT_473811 [Caerostris extrusa]|uniref:Uncharacterized protein n=1 Tax=Caerostris extrusa TaxID=172846 RepID=A0AAV4UMI3_CAEEX|nr:hypothetical protein CEXT_473811 [Caerostris extrusa]